MTAAAPPVNPSRPPAGRSGHGSTATLSFRPDIEGLRAVAIGLVLLYHAGLPWIPGGFAGVDIFFVISGFLITGVIVREVAQTGRLSLAGFYARRVRRLLPATVAVLVTTAVLSFVFLPVSQRALFGGDIAAAAGYVVNWRLADRAVDYLAEDAGSSPVQHFWSLAVEEQFYVLWPFLIMLLLAVAHKISPGHRARFRTGLLSIGLAIIVIPSFFWALHQTAVSPTTSFFVTTTRLWELGVGAALAIGLASLSRMPRRVSTALASVGLAAMVIPVFFLDASTAWPGAATLFPVLGTAAVIAAGAAHHDTAVGSLLSWRPMVWLGGLSYSLYLWHWPLLVFATAQHGGPLGFKRGLLVVLVSFIPAWISYRFVERPVRTSRRLIKSPGLTLSVGVNCTLVGILAGGLLMISTPDRTTTSASQGDAAQGAEALRQQGVDLEAIASAKTATSITPDPLYAVDDAPQLYIDGCQMKAGVSSAEVCSYGDPDGPLTMYMVGDSKVAQWQPALDRYAQENGYKLKTLIKSSCTMSPATLYKDDAPFQDCLDWGQDALSILLEEDPDVIVYGGGASRAMNDPLDKDAGTSPRALEEAIVSTWEQLAGDGTKVIALLDNPTPGQLAPVYDCVLANLDALDACSFEREKGDQHSGAPVQRAAAEQMPEVGVLDLADITCPAGTCPAVIGDVLVYRQGSHLTTTYVDSASPFVAERLDALLKE